jgi:hypothetical protein
MKRVGTTMGKASKKGRRPPQHKPVFYVPSTLLRKKGEEVHAKINALKLNSKSLGGSIKTGNRPLSDRTKEIYASHFKNVERFCCFIAKYDSCIIFMEKPPKYIIPVEAEVLVLYLRFKFWDETKDLLDLSNEPVKDGNGRTINCVGQWKDPDNANQLHSAMNAIHAARNCEGPYREECLDCCALPDSIKFHGCEAHIGQPCLRRVGDPSKSNAFKNEMVAVRKLAAERGYTVCGSSTCLPGDYRDAREYLVSRNDIFDLMFYCIMLFSARAYLRKSEHLGIQMNQFNQNLTVIPFGFVEGLNWWVFGKTDKQRRYLWTWKDDETPTFCFVRHLLIYVYICEIRGGFLFPTQEELRNPPDDGIFETEYSYSAYLKRLKYIFHAILKRPAIKVGAHTGRKFAHLFETFGGATATQNQKAAGHKDLRQSERYTEDAEALLELYRLQHDDSGRHQVSKYRPIECSGPANAELVNERSGKYQTTLYDLAVNYVEKQLGVKKDNPRSKDVRYLLGKALAEHTHPPNDFHEFLDEFGLGDDEDKKRRAEVQ